MKLSFTNSLLAATVIAGTASFAPISGAAVVFDETFESYTLGDADGQGLWVTFGGREVANIVNTNANGGTQSIEFITGVFDPTRGAGDQQYGSDYTIDLLAPITSGQLVLSFDIFQPAAFDGTANIYISRGATNAPTFIFDEGLHLMGNGLAGTFGDTGSPTTPLLRDQWVPVLLNIDLDANTLVASYGATEIFNGAWNNGGATPTQYQGINIWATGGGATVAPFNIDNLRLETVPEPTGIAFLGLGLLGLIARRRRG